MPNPLPEAGPNGRPVVRRAPRRGRLLANRSPLVDALPDFADQLGADRLEIIRRVVRVRLLAVRRGIWDAAGDAEATGAIGMVIVSGTVLRRVVAGHREGAELLGAGDLVQPARDTTNVSWRVVADCTVAVVDLRALADAATVPELTSALLGAATTRTHTVARQLVIAQWPSVDERLVATLQALAERWGVMTPDGIVLPDFLTHSVLAPLVGARRPSVTTSLKRLNDSGAVRRRPDGRWLLDSGATTAAAA